MALGASAASIRRDLRRLQQAGLLTRTHGGAMSNVAAAFEPSLAEKEDRFQPEKAAIARVAAGLIEDGDTVLLDSGSTTFEIARLLRQRREVTVVTNAINIARELASADVEVILTGGSLRGKTLSLVGPIAGATLEVLHVDKLFLATNGVDVKKGLTTPNLAEAQAKKAMVDSAREVILVADHSKFGRVAFGQFCPLNRLDRVITDRAPGAEFLTALGECGVELLLAEEAGDR